MSSKLGLMGKVFSSLIRRPLKNYNVEERARKVISADKPKPAPRHPTTLKYYDDVTDKTSSSTDLKSDVQLINRLKKIEIKELKGTGKPNFQSQNEVKGTMLTNLQSHDGLKGTGSPELQGTVSPNFQEKKGTGQSIFKDHEAVKGTVPPNFQSNLEVKGTVSPDEFQDQQDIKGTVPQKSQEEVKGTPESRDHSQVKGTGLPEARGQVELPEIGFVEPSRVKKGHVTLTQAFELLTRHQEDPRVYNAQRIGSDYGVDPIIIEQILKHYKLLTVKLNKSKNQIPVLDQNKIKALIMGPTQK